MTKQQPANDNSAIGKLAKEIAGEIRKSFDAYKFALEAVTATMLDDVEIERCMREKEIKALRAELADVKYALREQLRSRNLLGFSINKGTRNIAVFERVQLELFGVAQRAFGFAQATDRERLTGVDDLTALKTKVRYTGHFVIWRCGVSGKRGRAGENKDYRADYSHRPNKPQFDKAQVHRQESHRD